jgi:Antitoxin Phd_YefM, type II toxin-antitoxin system
MRNIIPITDLQQKTKKYVDRVRSTGVPIVITQRGLSSSYSGFGGRFRGPADYPRRNVLRGPAGKAPPCLGRIPGRQGIELEELLRREKRRGAARSRRLFLLPQAYEDFQLVAEPLRSEIYYRVV